MKQRQSWNGLLFHMELFHTDLVLLLDAPYTHMLSDSAEELQL
jgi:hypothetical protein